MQQMRKRRKSNLIWIYFDGRKFCILIGKDGEYEKTEKRMQKFQTPCAMAFSPKFSSDIFAR